MNCSVPANEPITATVAITNAAGLTASKSAYAGLLKLKLQIHNYLTASMITVLRDLLSFINPLDVLAQACSQST